jgi:hypothetical protein
MRYDISRKFTVYFVIHIPFFRLNKNKRYELEKLLKRLNSDKTPEHIVLEQFLYFIFFGVSALIISKGNLAFGLILAFFAILGYMYPVDELRKSVKIKNKNILLDFPEFYSLVYYQYSKSVNIFFSDILRDYIPNANDDMAEELGIMLDNIDYKNEEFALKQFKQRVPEQYIIKFCDIIETRLRGYDNISQLSYFKNEIDSIRISELNKEIESRIKKNNIIQILLVIVLILYIFIYYLFTILDSIAMFQ